MRAVIISVVLLSASAYLYAQKRLPALHVSTFSFDEAQKSANVVLGESCAYSLAGTKDTAIIFACSFTSHQAVIRVGEHLAVLHERAVSVHTEKSVVAFANRFYRVTIIGKNMESGVMTVTEIRSGKHWRYEVKGECGL